jgi:hypothetical protein
MNRVKNFQILVMLFAAVLCFGRAGLAGPVGTAFTYQGRLIDANVAADGLYDFQFKLFDANSDGNQLGVDVNLPEVDVIDGYFTVELDFGGVFYGNACWLEIGVRPGDLNDPNIYTVLTHRQKATPTPYALYALEGGTSGSIWQMNGSDIYYNNGNVGIGTTTVSSPLTIKTVAGSDIELVSTGSNADIMTNAAFKVGTSTSQPFSIITNNLYQMTVDSTGNVGIGTTSPAVKLDVAGGVRLGDVTTCDGSNEGTLRYNSGEVQYCDGTSWKTLEPTTPIIWSGGCSTHGRAAGWNTYCNDRVDFNTAAAYISADGNGTFTLLKSGYYRINFWCISDMVGYTNIQFVKNGSYFIYTMNYLNNQWTDNIADQIWPFNAGDSLQIRVYNSGGNNYAYHSWNSSGAHSRVQISYEGPLD